MAVLGTLNSGLPDLPPSPTPTLPLPWTNPAVLRKAFHPPHTHLELGRAPPSALALPHRPLWARGSCRCRTGPGGHHGLDHPRLDRSVQCLHVAERLPSLAPQSLLPQVLEYVAAFCVKLVDRRSLKPPIPLISCATFIHSFSAIHWILATGCMRGQQCSVLLAGHV